jgi:hypothetical protein
MATAHVFASTMRCAEHISVVCDVMLRVVAKQVMPLYKAEAVALVAKAAVHSYSTSRPPDTARATALMRSMHKVSASTDSNIDSV